MKKVFSQHKQVPICLLLMFIVKFSFGQNIVSGIVTDATDQSALVAVSVVVKGSLRGTVTDANGKYSIDVPESATLVFSFTGFDAKEVTVGTKSTINVTLAASENLLNEVVVVGYGSQKKSDLTGSVATVSGRDIVKTTVAGVDQALQGRVAGVTVTSNSGSPGSGVTVRVRGIGTVGNASPLYIVDGVPYDNILSLNMDDVESINILKDASSSAIYGSRAANGVVLITTKTGKAGKITASYSGYVGVQSAWKKLDVLNAQQWATLYNEATLNDNLPANQELANPGSLTSYDWTKLAYQNGMVQNHQFSVSGGSEKGKFYISANQFKQDGIIKTTGYERLSIRSNNSYYLTDKIEIGSNLSYSRGIKSSNDESGINIDNRMAFMGFVMDPVTAIYKEDGTPNTSPYRSNSITPLARILYNGTSQNQNYLFGNAYAKIDILKNLSVRSNFAITSNGASSDIYLPAYFISGYQSRGVNSYSAYRSENITKVWTSTLNYNHDFNKHHLEGMVGYETQNTKYDFITAARNNIPLSITNPTLGSGNTGTASNDGSKSESQLISFFGRVNYNYASKYFITANLRRDGSSRFGPSNRWGIFPSFAAAWDLKKENFFQSNLISQFKFRGGYGEIGNQNFADYSYFQIISTGNNVTFGKPEALNPGLAPRSQGNPNLKWETSRSTNVGLDLGLFNSSLNFTVDYFVKTTTDMLLRLPVADIVGIVTPPFQNAGKIRNQGLEISSDYRTNVGQLQIQVGGNISFIRNEVLNLGPAGNSIEVKGLVDYAPIGISRVGQSLGSFIGYQMDGLFQTPDEVKSSSQPNAMPGDIKYRDINGDGKIDAADRTIIGSPLPKATYGLNLSLQYKGFDLSSLFQGSQGNDIYSLVAFAMDASVTTNSTTAVLDRWTGPGTSNEIPRVTRINNGQNIVPSSRFVYDGSYLRLKNLQIGYNFKKNALKLFHLTNLRTYIGAQNLLTFDKYEVGMDPEIGIDPSANSPLDIGVDRGTYPQARTFIFGLNASF